MGIQTIDDIGAVARQGIGLVEDCRLRAALDAVYQSPLGTGIVKVGNATFSELTSSRWSAPTLCRFLAGWRATHGTALYVSGLVIRLHRSAEEAEGSSRLLLHQAAAQISEIIPEDTGVDDTPHDELFAAFANHMVGDDRWKLGMYSLPGCNQFRDYVKEQRLFATVEEGILTTAASENWNAGEYTYLSSRVRPWMLDVLGQEPKLVEEKIRYITAHAGDTELGHFLHALQAWRLYCAAMRRQPEPTMAASVFERYLIRLGGALRALHTTVGAGG